MGSVNFSELPHFIEELRSSRRLVEQSLVRLVVIKNEGFWCSSVRRTHVIVTARIGQDIVRLDLFYGPPSDWHAHDRKADRPMTRDLQQLRKACRACDLDIRRGVLEETLVLQ